MSSRSRELLQVIEKLRGEFDVTKDKERAREEECEELQAKCEAAMTEFEKKATVVALPEKICTLSTEVKEHKVSLDRMMLESQKWAGYQQSLLILESKVTFLEAEKGRLEADEVSIQKEVKELKHDRRELAHSDDIGSLVEMKEPFNLSKVKGYRSSYKKDHIQAINDLVTATFPWLDEFMVDPSAPIKSLLSKKHPSLQRPAPSRTQVPFPSSQRATPSSVPVSNWMSPPTDVSVVKPQSSQLQ
ncbi:hypothetical protein Tco_0980712 [Tanacetum coccineum]